MRSHGIPILTYHSMRIHGRSYEQNDLVALAQDLEVIDALSLRIEPLARIVEAFLRRDTAFFAAGVVGLSCDDGSDFDFHDLDHPVAGRQRSVLGVLRDHHRRGGSRPHITSFVVASPDARRELDRSCMLGLGWWRDDWWADAVASGFMDVANHSWDHNHETLPKHLCVGVETGTFRNIDSRRLADLQILQARKYILARASNPGARLFAYPYGDANAYLIREYFERHGRGLHAAFGDTARPMTVASPRWYLPRYICGRDWRAPEQLREILRAARAR